MPASWMHAEVDDHAVLGKAHSEGRKSKFRRAESSPKNIVDEVDQGKHGGPPESIVVVVWGRIGGLHRYRTFDGGKRTTSGLISYMPCSGNHPSRRRKALGPEENGFFRLIGYIFPDVALLLDRGKEDNWWIANREFRLAVLSVRQSPWVRRQSEISRRGAA
jgi:hypothetical protein